MQKNKPFMGYSFTAYIVIPVHNRELFTNECLLSLGRQSFHNLKIVVVDDGSVDGTAELIRNNFPDVIMLPGDGNLWWTRSVNKAIRYVLSIADSEDVIVTLNNDLVVDPQYIELLCLHHSMNRKTLIGSLNIDIADRNTIYDGGVLINLWTASYRILHKGKKRGDVIVPGSTQLVSTLSGRGTLIPVPVFKKIGLFDEHRLPHYGADYEFALRAKNNGFSLLIANDAVVYSHVNETGLKSNKMSFYNYFFSIKSPGNLRYRFRFAIRSSTNPLQIIFYLIFDVIRNIGHFLKNLPSPS